MAGRSLPPAARTKKSNPMDAAYVPEINALLEQGRSDAARVMLEQLAGAGNVSAVVHLATDSFLFGDEALKTRWTAVWDQLVTAEQPYAMYCRALHHETLHEFDRADELLARSAALGFAPAQTELQEIRRGAKDWQRR
jgi:hypothetical protein